MFGEVNSDIPIRHKYNSMVFNLSSSVQICLPYWVGISATFFSIMSILLHYFTWDCMTFLNEWLMWNKALFLHVVFSFYQLRVDFMSPWGIYTPYGGITLLCGTLGAYLQICFSNGWYEGKSYEWLKLMGDSIHIGGVGSFVEVIFYGVNGFCRLLGSYVIGNECSQSYSINSSSSWLSWLS